MLFPYPSTPHKGVVALVIRNEEIQLRSRPDVVHARGRGARAAAAEVEDECPMFVAIFGIPHKFYIYYYYHYYYYYFSLLLYYV